MGGVGVGVLLLLVLVLVLVLGSLLLPATIYYELNSYYLLLSTT